jgi:uncharacterized membrane protein SpoIIM required for sporulation
MSADRDAFVAERRARWQELDALLGNESRSAEDWAKTASLYRALCADLARAQSLSLGDDVRAYLDQLSGRAHNQLYGVRPSGGTRVREFLGRDFPREVRASWRYVALAGALFYLPFLLGIVGSLVDPRFAPSVLPPEQLQQMEDMYSSGELVRASGEDALMGGFYVQHNVGIAFQCFATGALGGVGSMFFLVYNGLVLGTVLGHLTSQGMGVTVWSYVAGHSAWELTGIVLSGAAGLKLGWAMIDTDGLTRSASLRRAAPALFRLIGGAAAFLIVAASIEGFWSASPVPNPVKWVFGFAQIAIVASWLTFGGRRG